MSARDSVPAPKPTFYVYAVVDTRDGSLVCVELTRKDARDFLANLRELHREPYADLRVRRARLQTYES